MPRISKRRLAGQELVDNLNAVVAQLIKENRQLKRQVQKLTARGAVGTNVGIDRSLRSIQRRAPKAIKAQPKRRRRGASAKTVGRPRAAKKSN